MGDFNGWAGDYMLSTTDHINYSASNVTLTTVFDIYGRATHSQENVEITDGYNQLIQLPKGQLSFIIITHGNSKTVLKVVN